MRAKDGRPIRDDSKLAQLIREDDRPGYLIAAEAGLSTWQLEGMYKRRKMLSLVQLRRLCAVLECELEDILEDGWRPHDETASPTGKPPN